MLLSSFLLGAIAKSDKHDVEPELRPCAKQLNDWAIDRLDRLKDEERDDERLNIPRDWIIAMNRQCFKGQHMAARGMSTRMPVTWNEQEFFQAPDLRKRRVEARNFEEHRGEETLPPGTTRARRLRTQVQMRAHMHHTRAHGYIRAGAFRFDDSDRLANRQHYARAARASLRVDRPAQLTCHRRLQRCSCPQDEAPEFWHRLAAAPPPPPHERNARSRPRQAGGEADHTAPIAMRRRPEHRAPQ